MHENIFEWQSYLNELNSEKYQLFCDMDGCLVNFAVGAVAEINSYFEKLVENPSLEETEHPYRFKRALKAAEVLGKDISKGELPQLSSIGEIWKVGIGTGLEATKPIRSLMYAIIADSEEFWANLKWMPQGKKLWASIERFNPIILSGPMSKGSIRGKYIWCEKNLNYSKDRIILTHDKSKFANFNGKVGVLIDDLIKYGEPFAAAGGIFLHYSETEENVAAVMNKLKMLGIA